MENAITPALSIAIGILLFAVGYLLGERRISGEAKAENLEVPKPAPAIGQPVSEYHIPKAPPAQIDRNNGGKTIRVVSPREAIFQEMQKRDGLVETPERIPPSVANKFLKETKPPVAKTDN